MFISRVEMSWDAVRNPYEIHRRLWRLFPGEGKETRQASEEVRQGFLFRVEQYAAGRPVRVLLQSRLEPVAAEGVALLGARRFDPQPEVGQSLAFLLTANPVKTVVDALKDDKPGKSSATARVPLVKEEDQRTWLIRKLSPGAGVEQATVLAHEPIYFRKSNRAGKIVSATFEGVLRVRDGAALQDMLAKGIGPAKSFGCGLLLLRRIS